MAETYKIAIIGSGPAGLSAAAHAAALGLSHVLIEKTDRISNTIAKYQKGKHIMATPEALVLRSDLTFQADTRENILAVWKEQTETGQINVQYGSDVTEIIGEQGAFTVKFSKGESLQAENIVLAIGTQGNPNRMRVPGGDLPFIQYTLDDPDAFFDEDIIVIGGGDAGIENALGLCANADLENRVTLLQRGPDFATAKDANVSALIKAASEGRMTIITDATASSVEQGWINIDVKDGTERLPCDRIIARMGSAPPRKFVEASGVSFTSEERTAYPQLSSKFESTKPGIFVIGALAGYPLIKHCINQGYDVIEHINGNDALEPADEPLLQEKFKALPGHNSATEILELFRKNVTIFNDLTPLQMREFMLDSTVTVVRAGDIIFERNDIGASLFSIVQGSVGVQVDPNDVTKIVVIDSGEIFGETGLISGRRRNATIVAQESCVLIETPRKAARKLISTVPAVKRAIDLIATERQILQIFGSGLNKTDIYDITHDAEVSTVSAGTLIITEGDTGTDLFIIRSGSMLVEKNIADKDVFLSYVPAGSYVGEMALFEEGRRTASVKAAVKSEIIRVKGEHFEALLAKKPQLKSKIMDAFSDRRAMNAYVEAQKENFNSVTDLYGARANFLIAQGLGEATDALLIDESLCIGCDNCEVACAESHDGISRLNREAGTTFAHIHVPTSCRHCEHPHCMSDCPPDAIHRAPDGEVFIDDSCIGCGNCQRSCPYGVIQMERMPPRKPGLLPWMAFGIGPGPGQPGKGWIQKKTKNKSMDTPKKAVKCDMCKGIKGGAACVRACPTGAALRISPEAYFSMSKKN